MVNFRSPFSRPTFKMTIESTETRQGGIIKHADWSTLDSEDLNETMRDILGRRFTTNHIAVALKIPVLVMLTLMSLCSFSSEASIVVMEKSSNSNDSSSYSILSKLRLQWIGTCKELKI